MSSIGQWLETASRVTYPSRPVPGEEMDLMERLAQEASRAGQASNAPWASTRASKPASSKAANRNPVDPPAARRLANPPIEPGRH